MARAAATRLEQDDPDLLQYGHELGGGPFLITLSRFLSEQLGCPVDPQQLMVTCGVSQALDLICHRYTNRGDVVFVEEPSYFLGLEILRDHGLMIVPIPMDENGLIIEALEEALKHHRPALLYTIPIFHNPATVTLSTSRRQRLVELSQEYNFLLLCDEVYHLLGYGNSSRPKPMRSFGRSNHVVSLGSFSKILAPGLRLGWIEADSEHLTHIAQAGVIQSGGGLNPFTAELVHVAIEQGLQVQHLHHVRDTYGRRARTLSKALRKYLPEFDFAAVKGGFFIWLRLEGGVDAKRLNTIGAERFDVRFKAGSAFSSQGELLHYARLCFAYHHGAELEEGVRRLAAAWETYKCTNQIT